MLMFDFRRAGRQRRKRKIPSVLTWSYQGHEGGVCSTLPTPSSDIRRSSSSQLSPSSAAFTWKPFLCSSAPTCHIFVFFLAAKSFFISVYLGSSSPLPRAPLPLHSAYPSYLCSLCTFSYSPCNVPHLPLPPLPRRPPLIISSHRVSLPLIALLLLHLIHRFRHRFSRTQIDC